MLHETQLSNSEEMAYRQWLSSQGQAPGMGKVDKSWSHKEYDLRGVFKKYGPVDLKKAKLPDEFKKSESMAPKETEQNWASRKSDSMASSNVAPWYSGDKGAGFDTGGAPWDTGAKDV